ncbi:chitin-binding domain protein cbd-1-like [Haliotis cracherodii]|uniref:chitin-binding domain protein cbd-1-like n=1 Tax=Haliotis cracherodii TaxID=6455 RepID=UPI0039E956FD
MKKGNPRPICTVPAYAPGTGFCGGRVDGYYPSAVSCGEFYHCMHGTTYVLVCFSGSEFNPITIACEKAGTFKCTIGSNPVDGVAMEQDLTKFCDNSRDGLYPNPNDCTLYLHCYEGRTFSMSCSPGLAFNTKGYCDFPENVLGCK